MIDYFNVKEYDFLNPSNNEIDYIVNFADVNWEDKFFHWFVYKCVFNIKFIIAINNKEVIFHVTLRYGEYKVFKSDELDVIIRKIEDKGFIFYQILKLIMKFFSNLTIINIEYYIKLCITIMHRKFLQKISQNLEYVKQICNDENNPFRFEIREWTICM